MSGNYNIHHKSLKRCGWLTWILNLEWIHLHYIQTTPNLQVQKMYFSDVTSSCIILILSICYILWVFKRESKTNFPFSLFDFQDTHGSDSDKDDNVEDNPGQEVHKTRQETKSEPKVSATERTAGTPAGRELDPRRCHVISTSTDGAGCCQPQDSEKEELCKSCSGFALSCVYPSELHRHLREPSIPNGFLHSAQVNTWSSCATTDRAAPCALSLAAPAGSPGFPISLQQHALVQVHRRPTNQWNAS